MLLATKVKNYRTEPNSILEDRMGQEVERFPCFTQKLYFLR